MGGILILAGTLLFFISIVGLIVPRWVKLASRKGVLLKMFIPAFVIFIIGGSLLPDSSDVNSAGPHDVEITEKSKVGSGDKEKPIIVAPVSVPISSLSFKEIRLNMESMTDLQFEEYAKSNKGKRIKWEGYVEEVSEKLFGGYEVLVDMDSPNVPMSIQDVTFELSKKQAILLKKDSRVVFEGTITSVRSILTSLQVSLDEAQVI